MNLHLVVEGQPYEVHLEPSEEGAYKVTVNGEPFEVHLEADGQGMVCTLGAASHRVERKGRALFVDEERADVAVAHLAQARAGVGHAAGGEITPPMPGRIVEVLVEQGQAVAEGETLLVLEAMKMQNEIQAPGAGVVKEVRVAEGDAVEASDVMLVLEPS